ncbi:FAD-dependent monooxygenase [Lentzea indica]|uniref:FAD-dependent monooxygenase n=1 Tax=Lentzea indica TaxID=2604800 RepID=UPI0028AC7500|nr:FAD-dependent monooxygenase [Lentzea indica]
MLEREQEPGSPWRVEPLGMRGLFGASVQALHRRGLLEPLHEVPDTDQPLRPRGVGHFAGMMLDPADVDVDALPFRLPSPVPEMVMTSLAAVEAVLAERVVKLGVEIRRGVTARAVAQDDETVVVGDGEREYAARWVVGCDGGRSAVRKLAGFDFVGTEPQFTGYQMLATFADPEQLAVGFTLTATGMYLRMPGERRIGVMDFDGGAFDRSQPPTREHLQAVLRRVSGTDVTVTDVQHASSFTDRAMQTTTYRSGRVLLAGDAAHIMSPLGGQGLNTGIGDAVNLGWKLATTVHGTAPAGLLDTYTRERHPVGAAALDWTRAQVAVMRPDPHSQASQRMLRDLLGTRDGTTYVFQKVSGAAIRHDLGSDHPLVGRTAPDFRFEDGTRLSDLMQNGRGAALDFTAVLGDSAARWENQLRYATGPATDDLGLGAVLVRPDGVVAWTGADRREFEQAALRWFGTPQG